MMPRRFALLVLVAVCLTAAMAQAQPEWWTDFDDKGDDGNGGDEKEPFSFDDLEWWPDLPDFGAKLDWLPSI